MNDSLYIGEIFDMDTHRIGLGMRIKDLLVPGLAAALLISACAKDPAPPPAPTGPTAEEIAQQRAAAAVAESVREFLSGFGISGDRLTTTSFGEDRPLVSRSDENAWSRNRRVEFAITGGTIVP